MNESTELGTLMRAKRAELKISQQQLANKLGVDRTFISHIENGRKKPTEQMLFRILNALGIPLTDILTDEEVQCLTPEMGLLLNNAQDITFFLGENLEPEKNADFVHWLGGNAERIATAMQAVMTELPLQAAPSGWALLSDQERKVIQELINIILKNRKEEDNG